MNGVRQCMAAVCLPALEPRLRWPFIFRSPLADGGGGLPALPAWLGWRRQPQTVAEGVQHGDGWRCGDEPLSRRAAVARPALLPGPRLMVRLGGHGLPVAGDDPYAFARAHRDFGYGAAYVPEVGIGDTQRLLDIEKAFAAEDVMLAEIGIWRNLITPDYKVRK